MSDSGTLTDEEEVLNFTGKLIKGDREALRRKFID